MAFNNKIDHGSGQWCNDNNNDDSTDDSNDDNGRCDQQPLFLIPTLLRQLLLHGFSSSL